MLIKKNIIMQMLIIDLMNKVIFFYLSDIR